MRLYAVLLALALLASACGGGGKAGLKPPDAGASAPGVAPTVAQPQTLAELSQQLDTLPVPDAVNPARWAEIKAALYQAVASQCAAKHTSRIVSAAPVSAASRASLSWDGPSALLSWNYQVQGDYTQDGAVTINDLTPLGQHFGKQSPTFPYPFLEDSVESVVDGNGDGEINISDITPIGANFGAEALGGYDVFASNSLADYPLGNGDAPLVPALDNAPFTTANGDKATQRLLFSYVVATPLPGVYYWVRPRDSAGNDGTPSYATSDNYEQFNLEILNPPAPGSGSFADPYIADIATEYYFKVSGPVSGDVSLDPHTTYSLSDAAAGSLTNVDATLNIGDGYIGQFQVLAYFAGGQTWGGPWLRVPLTGQQPPVLTLLNPPAQGSGTLADPYIADVSTIYQFQLVDTQLGDVSTKPGTLFQLNHSGPGDPGWFPTGFAMLNIKDAYFGDLWVNASFMGLAAPDTIYMNVPPPPNQPPDVLLAADSQAGAPPHQVTFSTVASDTDGTVDKYEFDWDGAANGFTWVDNGANAQAQHQYNSAGIYDAWVRVTDNMGATAEDHLTIAVYNWNIVTVDQGTPVANKTGKYCSLAEVAGLPCIAYNDSTANSLWFAYDAANPAPQKLMEVDGSGNLGLFSSLSNLGGRAGIAYWDVGGPDLKFAYALQDAPQTAADFATHVVDPASSVGYGCVLAKLGKTPVIAYADQANLTIKFARSQLSVPIGSADWAIHTVASAGQYPSLDLKIINGMPAIAYYDDASKILKYARATVAEPGSAADWVFSTIDDAGDVGLFPSLVEASGARPAVTYFDASNNDLKFAYGTSSPSSAADWTSYAIDQSDKGRGSSLVSMNGGATLCAVYFNGVGQDLRLAVSQRDLPATPAAWLLIGAEIDSDSESFCSLAVVAGKLSCAYYAADFFDGRLMLATLE